MKTFVVALLTSTHNLCFHEEIKPASVAQLDAPSDWRPGGRGFDPAEVGNILSWRLIMKYFLSLPLIQEGQLSVSGERMCTILVNRLED